MALRDKAADRSIAIADRIAAARKLASDCAADPLVSLWADEAAASLQRALKKGTLDATARNRQARLYIGLTPRGIGSFVADIPTDAYTLAAVEPGKARTLDLVEATLSPSRSHRAFLNGASRPWEDDGATARLEPLAEPPEWTTQGGTCPETLRMTEPMICTTGSWWDLNPARATMVAFSRATTELARTSAGSRHSTLFTGYEARPEDGSGQKRPKQSDTVAQTAARAMTKALVHSNLEGSWTAPDGSIWVSVSVEKAWADKVAASAETDSGASFPGENVPRPRPEFTATGLGAGDVIAFGPGTTAIRATAELAALLAALHHLAADMYGTRVEHSFSESTQTVQTVESTKETIQFVETVSKLTTTATLSRAEASLQLKTVCKDYAAAHIRKVDHGRWNLDEEHVEYTIELGVNLDGRPDKAIVTDGIPILPPGTSASATLHAVKAALRAVGITIDSIDELPPINGAPLVEARLRYTP